jgi:hypothetical protein
LPENSNKVYEYNYVLKGHDDVTFAYDDLIYEPSHCVADFY